ncbi:MAG: hypothetical protein M3405_04905 [Acidobacteriota bacterium]|jgi:hypothetical protein|nr:hypothetical protein [Acidobacteriota bacterium]
MLHHRKINKKTANIFAFILCIIFLFSVSPADSQQIPDKIRGYKVYKTEISVTDESLENKEKKDFGVEIDFEEPELANVSLLGITLSLKSQVTVFGQSGTVDFILFKDFKVNDINVEIEEYRTSFDFKKGKSVQLEKPVEIFINTKQTLRGAVKEYKNSKDKWLITGRVFVFGRFKKFGFNFKRVIPVDVSLTIKNPLKTD